MAKLWSKISIKFHSRFFESGNFFWGTIVDMSVSCKLRAHFINHRQPQPVPFLTCIGQQANGSDRE